MIAHFFLALNKIPLSGCRGCFCFGLLFILAFIWLLLKQFQPARPFFPVTAWSRDHWVDLVASLRPKAAPPLVPNRWPHHPILAFSGQGLRHGGFQGDCEGTREKLWLFSVGHLSLTLLPRQLEQLGYISEFGEGRGTFCYFCSSRKEKF